MANRQHFFVHADLGDGKPVVAGYHRMDVQNHFGEFVYAGSYCENPRAFALDPINLPLVYGKRFHFPLSRESSGIPGAFLDCGPDEWGKRILNQFAQEQPVSAADYLVQGSGMGVGCLFFSDSKEALLIDTSVARTPQQAELSQMYHSAMAFDSQTDNWTELEQWLMPSSGIGGARPKAQVLYNNVACIAKFNRKDDAFDNALTEYCMMQLAEKAGIQCAKTHLVKTEHGHCVLVERFDVGAKRRHMLSAFALLNVHKISQLEQISYDRIAAVGKQIGSDFSLSKSVFKRMLFNVAIGNTDDHSRNHAFLKNLEDHQYRLSPAYDLVPLPYRLGAHAINLGPFGQSATVDNLQSCGKLIGLSQDEQRECAQAILTVTKDALAYLQENGLHERAAEVLKPCFAQRAVIEKLAS